MKIELQKNIVDIITHCVSPARIDTLIKQLITTIKRSETNKNLRVINKCKELT